jgi:C1A family cysteine protease
MEHQITLPNGAVKGMGWLRDYPSIRDFTAETDEDHRRLEKEVKAPAKLLQRTDVPEAVGAPPAGPIDLRPWCSKIEDQGGLGSCTAFASVGMLEYFQRKAFGKHIDASHRFLYKVTRKLGGFKGDSGAWLRTAMGAMTLFGVPPRQYWKYDEEKFDVEPPAFCYAFAQSFQALTYYRLDPPGTDPGTLVDTIKGHLASQLPAMFGFSCFPSLDLEKTFDTGEIPYPKANEDIISGHAVLAVGYDNAKKIKQPGGPETTGAFLIRNSWGTVWGMDGYGWLPYRYVEDQLADDWWVLLKQEWVDTGQFKT